MALDKVLRPSPSAPGKELPDPPSGAADDAFTLTATLDADGNAVLTWEPVA